MLDELASYSSFAVATLIALALIVLPAYAKQRGGRWRAVGLIPSLPLQRAKVAAVSFALAFVVFVGIDVTSGRVISRLAGDPVASAIMVGIFLAALFFDVFVLARRRRRPAH